MDYVIVVAGGQGLRMGCDIPKQFLDVGGIPILMHTIRCFREYSHALHIILVLPESQQSLWHELCQKHNFAEDVMIATGGQTRFDSVKNGLALIADDADGIVGIHDGVRPFVSQDVIHRCFEEAKEYGAVVPVMSIVETLWNKNGERSNRDDFFLGQTPQTFKISLLKQAYQQPYEEGFTDDASVVLKFGHKVKFIKGNRENIKITTPFDLKIAESIVSIRR